MSLRAQGASSMTSVQSRDLQLQLRNSGGVYDQEDSWVTVGSKVYKKFAVSTCGVTTVHALPLYNRGHHVKLVRPTFALRGVKPGNGLLDSWTL